MGNKFTVIDRFKLASERSLPLIVAWSIALTLAPITASALWQVSDIFFNSLVVNKVISVILILISILLNYFMVNSRIKSKIHLNPENKNLAGVVIALPIIFIEVAITIYRTFQGTFAQRFNYLFTSSEDHAAWVSLSKSILLNGSLPNQVSESEYYSYGSGALAPGSIIHFALSENGDKSYSNLINTSVNNVYANFLIAAITAIGIAIFLISFALSNHSRQKLPVVFVVIVTVVASNIAASMLAVNPIINGAFLGTTWTLLGLTFIWAILVTLKSNYSLFISAFFLFIFSTYATSVWPFTVIFLTALYMQRLVRLKFRVFKDLISTSILSGAIFGSYTGLIEVSKVASATDLSRANGITMPRDQIVLILLLLIITVLGFQVRINIELQDWLNPSFALLIAALLITVTIAFQQSGSQYAIAKAQYIVLAILLLLLIPVILICVPQLFTASSAMFVVLIFALLVMSNSMLSSILTASTNYRMGGEGSPGSKISSIVSKGNSFACLPDKEFNSERIYACNRWLSAISIENSYDDYNYRAALLFDSENSESIVERYKSIGYFDNKFVVSMNDFLE